MTLPLKSARGEHAIDAPLERSQDIDVVKFSCAGQTNHLHIGRIFQSHYTGKVGGCKGTVVAGKGEDICLPVGWNLLRLFRTFRFFNFLCVNYPYTFLLVDLTCSIIACTTFRPLCHNSSFMAVAESIMASN